MTPTPSGRCRSRLWALATCRSTPLDPHQEAQRVGAPTRLANASACTPPRIPLDRLLDTDVLTGTQKQELIAYRNR